MSGVAGVINNKKRHGEQLFTHRNIFPPTTFHPPIFTAAPTFHHRTNFSPVKTPLHQREHMRQVQKTGKES
jgi:hypothetical protein